MKTVGGRYKLSPNEEARLIKEETEKRRKLRLLQVREQSRTQAAKIRTAVKNEKHKQLVKLSSQLKAQLEEEKEEKIKKLEERYENTLKTIGQGHRGAKIQEIKESVREQQQTDKEIEDDIKSKLRYNEALQQYQTEKAWEEYQQMRLINARKEALEAEKKRAAEIAALPPPKPDPLVNFDLNDIAKPIPLTDVEAFAFTRFHMAEDWGVVKAAPTELEDARRAAEMEQERIDDLEAEKKRVVQERMEKARVRHKYALEKEILDHDYNNILHELSDLQREDRERRQNVVASIPKQVFLPPYKRIEEKEDRQRVMEGAFEDMYMKTTDYTGDISLAVDANPPPDTPEISQCLDTSGKTNIDDIPEPSVDLTVNKSILKDVTNTMKSTDSKDESTAKPESVLRKLFDRIKVQRKERDIKQNDEDTDVKEFLPSAKGKLSPEKDDVLSEYSLNDSVGKEKKPDKELADIPNIAHGNSPPTRDVPLPIRGQHVAMKDVVRDSMNKISDTASDVTDLTGVSDKDITVSDSSQSTNAFMEQLQNRESKQLLEEVMEQMKKIDLQRKELEEKLMHIDAQHQKISKLPHNKLADRPMANYRNDMPGPAVTSNEKQNTVTGKLSTSDQHTAQGHIPSTQDDSTLSSGPLQKSLDGSNVLPLQKVREYQQMLIERHKQSQKILEDTKQEIFERRQNMLERFPYVQSNGFTAENHQNIPVFLPKDDIPSSNKIAPISMSSFNNAGKDAVVSSEQDNSVTAAERSVTERHDVKGSSKKGEDDLDSIRKSLPFDDDDSPVKTPLSEMSGRVSNIRSDECDFESPALKSNGSSPKLNRIRKSKQDSGKREIIQQEAQQLQGLAEQQYKSLEMFKQQLIDLQNRKDEMMRRSEEIENNSFASQLTSSAGPEPTMEKNSADRHSKPPTSHNQLYEIHSHVPHDLSTILEMDTPVTMLSSGRPSAVDKSSSQLHSKRSLDFSQTSPDKNISENRSLLMPDKSGFPLNSWHVGGVADVLERAKEYDTSLLDRIKRQTNDVFSVLNEGDLTKENKSEQGQSPFSLSQHTISDVQGDPSFGLNFPSKPSLYESYKSAEWNLLSEDKGSSTGDISTSSQSSRHTWADELSMYKIKTNAFPVSKDFSLLSQESASFRHLTPSIEESKQSDITWHPKHDSDNFNPAVSVLSSTNDQSPERKVHSSMNSSVNFNLPPKIVQEQEEQGNKDLSQYSLNLINSSLSTGLSKNSSPLDRLSTGDIDRSASVGSSKNLSQHTIDRSSSVGLGNFSNFSVSSYGELADMVHRLGQPFQANGSSHYKTPEFLSLRPDSSVLTRLESTGEHPSQMHQLGISGLSQISDTSKSDYGIGKLESTGSEGHQSQAFFINGLSQISNISKPDSVSIGNDMGLTGDKSTPRIVTNGQIITESDGLKSHAGVPFLDKTNDSSPYRLSTVDKEVSDLSQFSISTENDLSTGNKNSLSQYSISDVSDMNKSSVSSPSGINPGTTKDSLAIESQPPSSLFVVSSLSRPSDSSFGEINQVTSDSTSVYLSSVLSSASGQPKASHLKNDLRNLSSLDEDKYHLGSFSISSYRELPDTSKLKEDNILGSSLYVPLEEASESGLELQNDTQSPNHSVRDLSIKTDVSGSRDGPKMFENDSHKGSALSAEATGLTQMSLVSSDRDEESNALFSENELGISDEPNLTLVTLGSETSFNNISEYSLSQSKEVTVDTSVPSSQLSNGNQTTENSFEDGVVIFSSGHKPHNNIPSLKDIFLQKKKDFVESSENRKAAVKEKVKLADPSNGTALSKTLYSWKKNRTMKKGPKPPVVSVKKMPSPKSVKTAEDRKKAQKEMLEVNKRLYNQLDEVKQKNMEKERAKKYAENREKAKEYQKKLQEKVKRNQDKKP